MHPQSTASYRVAFDVRAGIEPITLPASSTAAEIAEKVTSAFAAAEVPIAVNVAVDLEGDAVTVTEVYGQVIEHGSITRVDEQPQPEPDPRQRLAAELHRIADDIVTQQLPLNPMLSARLSVGVLDSRADLDRWAAYLGSTVKTDPTNDIPSTSQKIQLDGKPVGADLTIQAQTRPEQPSELERLRARVAELEAQQVEGGAAR